MPAFHSFPNVLEPMSLSFQPLLLLHLCPVVSTLRNCPMLKTEGAHLHTAISCLVRASMATSSPSVKGWMRGHHIDSSSLHCSWKHLNQFVVCHNRSITEGELHTNRHEVLSSPLLDSPVALNGHGIDGRSPHPHPHHSSLRGCCSPLSQR